MSENDKKLAVERGYNPPTFYWVATYKDGSTLAQFDGDGVEHQYSEVHQPALASFAFHPFSDALAAAIEYHVKRKGGLPTYRVQLQDGDTLVCYRTQLIPMAFAAGNPSPRATIYKVGIRDKFLLQIDEDGNVTVECP